MTPDAGRFGRTTRIASRKPFGGMGSLRCYARYRRISPCHSLLALLPAQHKDQRHPWPLHPSSRRLSRRREEVPRDEWRFRTFSIGVTFSGHTYLITHFRTPHTHHIAHELLYRTAFESHLNSSNRTETPPVRSKMDPSPPTTRGYNSLRLSRGDLALRRVECCGLWRLD